jgi:hypothetical protein
MPPSVKRMVATLLRYRSIVAVGSSERKSYRWSRSPPSAGAKRAVDRGLGLFSGAEKRAALRLMQYGHGLGKLLSGANAGDRSGAEVIL